MSAEWRLLRDGITDAHQHFALEEAILRLLDEGRSPPTLRLRQVQRAAFIGVFQDTWSEVDVDFCRRHGIAIVRRANGGGAVYHDLGSFCYSAFFPRSAFAQSDEELARLFAQPVIRTCADYGLEAHFSGRNDVVVGGRKIYGCAQVAWYGAFAQSGTFLVNMDFGVMEQVLTPPALKFAGTPGASVSQRVTSLERELGHSVDVDEAMARFTAHFSRLFSIRLLPGALTEAERELGHHLWKAKYSTDAWNLGSPRASGAALSIKTSVGVVSLSAELTPEGVLRSVRISGDLLLNNAAALAEVERALVGRPPEGAASFVRGALPDPELAEALVELLGQLSAQGPG
jgi:lipoate-protein ligase A